MKVILILIISGGWNGGKAIEQFDYPFESVEHCMAVGVQWESSENSNRHTTAKSFDCLIVSVGK